MENMTIFYIVTCPICIVLLLISSQLNILNKYLESILRIIDETGCDMKDVKEILFKARYRR